MPLLSTISDCSTIEDFESESDISSESDWESHSEFDSEREEDGFSESECAGDAAIKLDDAADGEASSEQPLECVRFSAIRPKRSVQSNDFV